MRSQSLNVGRGESSWLHGVHIGSITFAFMIRSFAIVTALMLVVGAVMTLPYGYFQLLRFVVCTCAGYLCCILLSSDEHSKWTAIMGVMAILFNPFLPVGLPRVVWRVFDVASAVLLIIAAFATKEPKSH